MLNLFHSLLQYVVRSICIPAILEMVYYILTLIATTEEKKKTFADEAFAHRLTVTRMHLSHCKGMQVC